MQAGQISSVYPCGYEPGCRFTRCLSFEGCGLALSPPCGLACAGSLSQLCTHMWPRQSLNNSSTRGFPVMKGLCGRQQEGGTDKAAGKGLDFVTSPALASPALGSSCSQFYTSHCFYRGALATNCPWAWQAAERNLQVTGSRVRGVS